MENDFKQELTTLINKYSMENGSDTPDYILSQYLVKCLEAFNYATNRRDVWYNDGKPKID